jgi:hypothetical protein
MNGSLEQADVCALLCTKQQGCPGIPAKAQHQSTSEISADKAAPTKVGNCTQIWRVWYHPISIRYTVLRFAARDR